jgi:prepilin-type N-terminal cleavage/methylation domain-containing protein
MRAPGGLRGATLTELMIAMALLGLIAVAFTGFLKYALKTTVHESSEAMGQESTRQGLEKLDLALVHANEITIASATMVEFITSIDQSPLWNPAALDPNGVPFERSADFDGDAAVIEPSSAAWRSGFNLTDDDSDGDGQIDVKQRLYFANGALWRDMSLNGEPWGGRVTKLLADVSTFTFTYWGSKANALGRNIDTNGDGIISASEMDCAPASGGNCNGALDLQVERNFITSIRIDLSVDVNHDGKTDYSIETDVYPPLLPLKPLQR